MVTEGFLARLEVRNGLDHECEKLLASLRPQGPWFAVRFGRSEYGIFAFGQAPSIEAAELLAGPPRIEKFSVLASKLAPEAAITRGLLLTFQPREGHAPQVEEFLRGTRSLVDNEPGTVAWFALRFASGAYGLFDLFPDNDARFAHLAGPLPRELNRQALTLLAGVPDMDLLEVVAAH